MAIASMQVESRLDLIHSITRKYGGQVKDVLEYRAQITKEYSLLTGSDLSSEDLEKELKRLEKSLVTLAQDLSDQRHALAQALENEIQQELADLYMDKARFQVRFSKAKFNREGNEAVEFYISTNPGEDFKPLVKVASGGELSRLMLAIKSAFSRKKEKPVSSLTRWIQESLGAWPKPSQRKFIRLVKMAKCLPFLTCLKSSLQQIINSILRKSVMNTQLYLLCVCSIEKNESKKLPRCWQERI